MTTIEDVLAGKEVKPRAGGRFAPRVEFSAESQRFIGIYLGFQLFEGQNKKQAKSHRFSYVGSDAGVQFMSGDPASAVDACVGLEVALTGKLIDDALTDADIKAQVLIAYEGEGKKKKGRNPTKLYRVSIIS